MALRLVAAGRAPAPEEFAHRGLRLSPAQAHALGVWGGLETRVAARAVAADGSVRLVLRLADGEAVEAVAMTGGAACLSTQVGCAVRCPFCLSGADGLRRNLSAPEIFEQLLHARREVPIDRVVFMGMGEPTHNLDNVLCAALWLRDLALISPSRITLSTVGSRTSLARLGTAPILPRLALSLHSADPEVRRRLLPGAASDPLSELVAAAAEYGRISREPLQFAWTLLAGVNDRDEDIESLCRLLAGVRGYVNFLLWNAAPGLPFSPTPRERAVALVRAAKTRGLLATIRRSVGADAEAACGQLRRRTLRGQAT